MNSFVLNKTNIFSPDNMLVIAEIGTSHGGSLSKAKEMVDSAFESGAVAVKFQIVYADEILHPQTGIVELPNGKIPLYEYFKKLEVAESFFIELSEYCKKKGVLFSASPFGIKSAKQLEELSPAFIKIASPELNHFPLLEEVATAGFPIVLSSGVSLLKDIESALLCLTESNPNLDKNNICLLHCVTSYPAPEVDYNLSVLHSLSALFGVSVGVSDHSLDPVLVPVLSMLNGACAVEKHFCLSKNDGGVDDPVALEPKQFKQMCGVLHYCSGRARNFVIDELVNLGYKKSLLTAIEGDGNKKLAKSESANYRRTNRSIHYTKDLLQGHIIMSDDIAILRTEKILSVGESPAYFNLFIGAILQKDVTAGAGAVFTDVICRGN